jgi:hypothetical protein
MSLDLDVFSTFNVYFKNLKLIIHRIIVLSVVLYGVKPYLLP